MRSGCWKNGIGRTGLGTFLLCGVLSAPLVAAAASSLPELKAEYDAAHGRIVGGAQAAHKGAGEKYIKSLDATLDKARSVGDVESLAALRKEKSRFLKEVAVPKESPADTHRVVVALRKMYHTYLGHVDAAAARSEVALLEEYIRNLEELKRNFAAAGKADEAEKAKADIRKTESALAEAVKLAPKPGTVVPEHPEWPGTLPPVGRFLSPELRRGMVLYYPFDKDEGKRIADMSDSGNHGAVSGTMWTPAGCKGGACRFDGRGQIEIPASQSMSSPAASGTGTIAFWLKTSKTNAGCVYSGFGSGVQDGLDVGVMTAGGGQRLTVRSHGDAGWVAGRAVVTDGKWHFLAVTAANTGAEAGCKLYVDGKEDGSASIAPLHSVPNRAHKIGTRDDGTGHLLTGTLDEIMVFNRALSAGEVGQLYKLGNPDSAVR